MCSGSHFLDDEEDFYTMREALLDVIDHYFEVGVWVCVHVCVCVCVCVCTCVCMCVCVHHVSG
jgi:hypothetical protein